MYLPPPREVEVEDLEEVRLVNVNVVDIVIQLKIAVDQTRLSSYDCGESARSLIRNHSAPRPYQPSLCMNEERYCGGD